MKLFKIVCILFSVSLRLTGFAQSPGEYHIVSAIQGKYLNVLGGNTAPKADVNIWYQNGSKDQKWTLRSVGGGFFTIQSHLGTYLDVQWGSSTVGALVHMWDYNGGDAQKWKFISAGGGYYYIQSKLGTYLDVKGAKSRNGTQVWMYSHNRTNAQKWKLVAEDKSRYDSKKMTAFLPVKHGYNFVNDWQTEIKIAGLNGPRFGGLCGGMAYSSLDYYLCRIQIPRQDYRPATGTPLAKYILNRQNKCSFGNADKWSELFMNPFGLRTEEFFNWGLQAKKKGHRINELKSKIDKGIPVPIGLFKAGSGGTGPHHQVLAIGYEVGKYKGDLRANIEDFVIYIYDSNHPNKIMALAADKSSKRYFYTNNPASEWLAYFVDLRYKKVQPLSKSPEITSNEGKIRELLVEIQTGTDDLRGGKDNVDLVIKYETLGAEVIKNINQSKRWINNYSESVRVQLKYPVSVDQIESISLKTSFRGGISGDNWNVNCIRIFALENGVKKEIYYNRGEPLVRFTGKNISYVASIQ